MLRRVRRREDGARTPREGPQGCGGSVRDEGTRKKMNTNASNPAGLVSPKAMDDGGDKRRGVAGEWGGGPPRMLGCKAES